MKKIGITGNIGSGKSQVTRYLISRGYKVLDADALVAEIYYDPDFIKEMTEKTVWSDTERLRELISEIKSQKESSLCCSGHTAAAGRALSYQSAVSMFMHHFFLSTEALPLFSGQFLMVRRRAG